MSENAATDDLGNTAIEVSPESIGPAPDQVEKTPSEEIAERKAPTASEIEEWMNDACDMEIIFNPSFNSMLRSLKSIDLAGDRDFLEGTREYLTARRDMAKSRLDDAGRFQDLKRYVRFQAKVSVVDILLSSDTLKARQRIRAKRRVK